MVMIVTRFTQIVIILFGPVLSVQAEDLGAMWGTAEREAEYYRIVDIAIPAEVPMHPGSFESLPDGRLAVGTRRGDVYFISGAFDRIPNQPTSFLRVGRTRSSECRGGRALFVSPSLERSPN